MKRSFSHILFLFLLPALLSSCTNQESAEPGLKDALEGKFYMGAALNGPQITGEDTMAVKVLKEHFNSITAENIMKSESIQPAEGEFDFSMADRFVEFGEANDMYIVGHCLVWHSQTPDWFFTDSSGKTVSREVMIERMKNHIQTFVSRYKGRVDCWDVVNEAILDDGSWRESMFYKIIGEDFIKLAFQFASEADPDADLLYNDYSMTNEGRRGTVIELVEDMKADGIKIDGIGMQAHYGLDYPALEEFEKSILAFAATGVKVHITELDISVLPSPWNRTGANIADRAEYMEMMNPYPDALPDSVSQGLNDRYLDIFELLLKHQDIVERVTTWGVNDSQSWKNGWPIRGRTDYPLLFDRQFDPKPVVGKIIELAGSEAH